MNVFLIVIAVIILAVAMLGVYRLIAFNRENRRFSMQQFERVKELYDKFERGENITEQDVLPFAKNIMTRETTYELLADQDKISLFPKEYYNLIAGAESNLANWLAFPTELGACPDEIEHIKRVTLDFDGQNNFVHYEVFKYRVNEPHWAAHEGWILGVVGPYFDDSKPYDFPQATFGRIDSTLDKVSPEDEVKWVHETIALRR